MSTATHKARRSYQQEATKTIRQRLNTSPSPFPAVDIRRLSVTERTALASYTEGNSLFINKYLRSLSLAGIPLAAQNALKQKGELITGLIYRLPASTARLVVYRAVEHIDPSWAATPVGAILPHTRSGLVSTSLSRKVAENFLDLEEGDDATAMLVLTLPKGTRGIYIGGASSFQEERELLLPHGTLFRVTRRSHIVHQGRRFLAIHATLSSQHAKRRRLPPPSKPSKVAPSRPRAPPRVSPPSSPPSLTGGSADDPIEL